MARNENRAVLGLKMFRLVATLCGSSLALAAQKSSSVQRASRLSKLIASHPSAGAYDGTRSIFRQRRIPLRLLPHLNWRFVLSLTRGSALHLALALLDSAMRARAFVNSVLRPVRPATPLPIHPRNGTRRAGWTMRRSPNSNSSQIISKIGSGARWTNKALIDQKLPAQSPA